MSLVKTNALPGENKLVFFTCFGPYHFWPIYGYHKARCLCGKRTVSNWKSNEARIVFVSDNQRRVGWRHRAYLDYLRLKVAIRKLQIKVEKPG